LSDGESTIQRGFKPFGREVISFEDYDNRTEKAFPKEKMEKYRTVQSMVIGAENWDLYSIEFSSIVGPDYRSVEDILKDLEERKKIVKVYDWFMGRKAEDYFKGNEVDEKVYTGTYKWYDRKYAEEKGLREVKCRHHLCSKTFHTEEDMKKHFDRTHRGFVGY
jgi:hypothetical protein